MNIDLLLSAMMVSHARGNLSVRGLLPFKAPDSAKDIPLVFECAPHSFRSRFRHAPITAVEDWFAYQRACGLEKITLWRPPEGEDYRLVGLSGYSSLSMICRYGNGDAAAFVPRWTGFEDGKRPGLRFTENHLVSYDIPHDTYHDNTQAFIAVLDEIAALAEDIGFPWFADRYREARDILTGSFPCSPDLLLPCMGETGKRLMNAALSADHFGCMGSWNDTPPIVAAEMGLKQDYDRLAAALFSELRMAVLYAANHG